MPQAAKSRSRCFARSTSSWRPRSWRRQRPPVRSVASSRFPSRSIRSRTRAQNCLSFLAFHPHAAVLRGCPHCQVLTALTDKNTFGYGVSLAPEKVVQVAQRFSAVNMNVAQFPMSQCLGISFFGSMVFSAMQPFVVVLLLFVAFKFKRYTGVT